MSNLYQMPLRQMPEHLGRLHTLNLSAIANLKKSLKSQTSLNTSQRLCRSQTKLSGSAEKQESSNARGSLACLIDDDFAAAMDLAGVRVIGRYFRVNDFGRAWADS